jgi:hypothetical protein
MIYCSQPCLVTDKHENVSVSQVGLQKKKKKKKNFFLIIILYIIKLNRERMGLCSSTMNSVTGCGTGEKMEGREVHQQWKNLISFHHNCTIYLFIYLF